MLSRELGKNGNLPQPKFTWNDLLQEIEELEGVEENAEALTTGELCEKWGWPQEPMYRDRVRVRMEMAIKLGRVRHIKAYRIDTRGHRYITDAYILESEK